MLCTALVAACALFGGCRTTAELKAERDSEFQTLVGGTMADFMRRTSLTPSDMYPTNSGRTFVIYGTASTIVLPGSYGGAVSGTQLSMPDACRDDRHGWEGRGRQLAHHTSHAERPLLIEAGV